MKRHTLAAPLLVVLGLAAPAVWATINAASHQREIAVCNDGSGDRKSLYTDGNCVPPPGAAYVEDWTDFSTATTEANLDAPGTLLNLRTKVNCRSMVDSVYREDNGNPLSLFSENPNSNPTADGRNRCEVEFSYNNGLYYHWAQDTEMWVGFSLYWSSNGWATSSNSTFSHMAQVIGDPGPYLAILVSHGGHAGGGSTRMPMKWELLEGETDGTKTKHTWVYDEGNPGNTALTPDLYFNRWMDFVYHVVFDPDDSGTGRVEVWVHDTCTDVTTKAIDYTGRVGFGDKIGATDEPYFKNGPYYGASANHNGEVKRVYHGPVRMQIGITNQYDVVAPRGTPHGNLCP